VADTSFCLFGGMKSQEVVFGFNSGGFKLLDVVENDFTMHGSPP
jgi:hypothetical protein